MRQTEANVSLIFLSCLLFLALMVPAFGQSDNETLPYLVAVDNSASPQAQAPSPAPSAPDLYQSSFSGNTYKNQFFGFSMDISTGWQYADLDVLKENDASDRAQELDALAKQTKRPDLVQNGVLHIPASYTLMLARSDTGSAESSEGRSLIVINAVEQSIPGDWAINGASSCGEAYFQEATFNGATPLGKLTSVQLAGRPFAQGDFKLNQSGKFVRILATCADKYYLVFHFVAPSTDEMQQLAEAAKSIKFTTP